MAMATATASTKRPRLLSDDITSPAINGTPTPLPATRPRIASKPPSPAATTSPRKPVKASYHLKPKSPLAPPARREPPVPTPTTTTKPPEKQSLRDFNRRGAAGKEKRIPSSHGPMKREGGAAALNPKTPAKEKTKPEAKSAAPPVLKEEEPAVLARRALLERKAALEAQIHTLTVDVADITLSLEREEKKEELAAERMRKLQSGGTAEKSVKDLVSRLLVSNDASFASLPAQPIFDFSSATAETDIPSTLPLAVANPLEQLKTFQSITFTSASASTDSDDSGVLQTHELQGYAGAHCIFFHTTLTVALSSLTVTTLEFALSPLWARKETTSFLSRAAESGDVSTLFYAIDSYAKLATTRARTFAKLTKAYPGLLPALTPARRTPSSKGKGKARDRPPAYSPSRQEVYAHLGSAVLRFRDREAAKDRIGAAGSAKEDTSEAEFVFEWRVDIDDVGEAESKISGAARVPGAWKSVDEETALDRIPWMFGKLVKEKGVEEAIVVVVGMLWPGCREW